MLGPEKHIFVWVPGTMGHEVHPSFDKALKAVVKENYQIIVVDYPATWNFAESVPVGKSNLKVALEEIFEEKSEDQVVYVSGSSQGSWVVSDALSERMDLAVQVHKTVLFGHPGVASSHDHTFDEDETYWEINDPKDAVAFGWNGHEERVINAIRDLHHFRLRALKTVAWALWNHPKTFWHLFFLVAYRLPGFNRHESPHDYSRQMPLAVYWLLN